MLQKKRINYSLITIMFYKKAIHERTEMSNDGIHEQRQLMQRGYVERYYCQVKRH